MKRINIVENGDEIKMKINDAYDGTGPAEAVDGTGILHRRIPSPIMKSIKPDFTHAQIRGKPGGQNREFFSNME
jgi:hypothetical protein